MSSSATTSPIGGPSTLSEAAARVRVDETTSCRSGAEASSRPMALRCALHRSRYLRYPQGREQPTPACIEQYENRCGPIGSDQPCAPHRTPKAEVAHPHTSQSCFGMAGSGRVRQGMRGGVRLRSRRPGRPHSRWQDVPVEHATLQYEQQTAWKQRSRRSRAATWPMAVQLVTGPVKTPPPAVVPVLLPGQRRPPANRAGCSPVLRAHQHEAGIVPVVVG